MVLHIALVMVPNVTSEPEVIFKKGESSLKMNLVPSIASTASTKPINNMQEVHKVEEKTVENPKPLQKKENPKVAAKSINNVSEDVPKEQKKILVEPEPLEKYEHQNAEPVAVTRPVNKIQKQVRKVEEKMIDNQKSEEKPEQSIEKHVKVEDVVVQKVKEINYSTEYFKPDNKIKDQQTQKHNINTQNSEEIIADVKAKGVTMGAMVKNIFKPSYPSSCKRKGHEGVTVLEVTILSNSKRGNIDIIKSAGCESLDKAAIKALKRAKYIPAKRLGVPFTATKKIAFNFKLEDYR